MQIETSLHKMKASCWFWMRPTKRNIRTRVLNYRWPGQYNTQYTQSRDVPLRMRLYIFRYPQRVFQMWTPQKNRLVKSCPLCFEFLVNQICLQSVHFSHFSSCFDKIKTKQSMMYTNNILRYNKTRFTATHRSPIQERVELVSEEHVRRCCEVSGEGFAHHFPVIS